MLTASVLFVTLFRPVKRLSLSLFFEARVGVRVQARFEALVVALVEALRADVVVTFESFHGARFASMFDHDEGSGLMGVDLARLHDILPAPLNGSPDS